MRRHRHPPGIRILKHPEEGREPEKVRVAIFVVVLTAIFETVMTGTVLQQALMSYLRQSRICGRAVMQETARPVPGAQGLSLQPLALENKRRGGSEHVRHAVERMPLELRAACGVIVGVCPLHHVVGVPDRSGMVLAGGVYAHGVDTEFPHFRLIRADPDRRGNDLIHGLHRLHAKFCGLFNPSARRNVLRKLSNSASRREVRLRHFSRRLPSSGMLRGFNACIGAAHRPSHPRFRRYARLQHPASPVPCG